MVGVGIIVLKGGVGLLNVEVGLRGLVGGIVIGCVGPIVTGVEDLVISN